MKLEYVINFQNAEKTQRVYTLDDDGTIDICGQKIKLTKDDFNKLGRTLARAEMNTLGIINAKAGLRVAK